MRRWVWFWICAILGLVLLICGLLVPAHLRALDISVAEAAGRKGPDLVERGLALLKQDRFGAAQLLSQGARDARVSGRQELELALNDTARQNPAWLAWGGGDSQLSALFEGDAALKPVSEPLTDFVIRLENRERVLDFLKASPNPAVQELLRFREQTNTTVFPPSSSSAGQALDGALSVCGLLVDRGVTGAGLSNSIVGLAMKANQGGDSQMFEQSLLDLMSLGQRLNWSQLAELVRPVQDTETLRLLSNLVRRTTEQLPVLYSAVQLSGKPRAVADYLMTYSQTGLQDVETVLRYHAGALDELLARNHRLYNGGWHAPVPAAARVAFERPEFALGLKWGLYFLGGFLLAAAGHFWWRAPSALERPLQVRGFHLVREALFALGFLAVVLLLSEPFLAQESQKVEFPFRLRLSFIGKVAPAVSPGVHAWFMKYSLITLFLFFVLQALLYTASLVKLAEIRRQRVLPRIKLKLLENEDHLFDAGLYLGFVGTIICLILVSLGVIKFSLMAAYSSTSFGIIFVSIFKIFHLRPLRRQLVLEAETGSAEAMTPGGRAALATGS